MHIYYRPAKHCTIYRILFLFGFNLLAGRLAPLILIFAGQLTTNLFNSLRQMPVENKILAYVNARCHKELGLGN